MTAWKDKQFLNSMNNKEVTIKYHKLKSNLSEKQLSEIIDKKFKEINNNQILIAYSKETEELIIKQTINNLIKIK